MYITILGIGYFQQVGLTQLLHVQRQKMIKIESIRLRTPLCLCNCMLSKPICGAAAVLLEKGLSSIILYGISYILPKDDSNNDAC